MVRRFLVVIALMTVGVLGATQALYAQDGDDSRLITVYDRGVKSVFLSNEKTIGAALKDKGYELDSRDTVEPSVEEELVAPDYHVNIYRARPVVVVDGQTRVKIVSPYQTAQHIAKDAGVSLYQEDKTTLTPLDDYVSDGAGLQLTIKRATPFILDFFGRKTEARTQGKTVGEMLKEKGIVLGETGRVSVPETTPITAGMEVRVWREGKQTVTLDEDVPYPSEQIFDADRQVGYRQVQTAGIPGAQSVTYEIEIKDGVELSRKEIARIDTKIPTKEVVIVGIKPGPNSLTKSKGAQYFVDSKGISHRETYYDLDMGVVMQACGQGGYYTVRGDGVKIDAQGYVIIAANYGRYPRCSVVETSVGPGKVYDTGGFATRYPDGFDLATDWTNYNGR
jgi:uncharacterized protein YabE (DUF348 family)